MFSIVLAVGFGVLGGVLWLLTGMGIPHAAIEGWALAGIVLSWVACMWLLSTRIPAGKYFRAPLAVSWALCLLVGLVVEALNSLGQGIALDGWVYVVVLAVVGGWWLVAFRRIARRRRADGNYW